MNKSKTGMKLVFIVVLLLIILPLAIFALLRCFPPLPGKSADPGVSSAEEAEPRRTRTVERRARHENRAVRVETTAVEPEETAEPAPVFEAVGAIDPNATHFKKATPYEPGTVPGDSGVVVRYAGSPGDGVSGRRPIAPDDPWGGPVQLPIPQGNR